MGGSIRKTQFFFLFNVKPLRPSCLKVMLVLSLGDSCQIIWQLYFIWPQHGWNDSDKKKKKSYGSSIAKNAPWKKNFLRNYQHCFKVSCHFLTKVIYFLYIVFMIFWREYLKKEEKEYRIIKKKERCLIAIIAKVLF